MIQRWLWLLLLIFPASSQAQWERTTSGVALPGLGLSASQGPETVALNPAAMAEVPSWGFSYVYADAPSETTFGQRGHAIFASSPVIAGISAGLGVDVLQPTLSSGLPERTRVSLALGWSSPYGLSVGSALRVLATDDPLLAGWVGWDAALSWRPVDGFAMGFQVRDLNAPASDTIDAALLRNYLLSMSFRPTGNRALTFDVAGLLDERGRFGVRGSAEVSIPFVGRLLAAAQFDRVDTGAPDVRLTGGLAVDWGRYGVGAGIHGGQGLDQPGWYVSGRVTGTARDGVPTGQYVLDLPLRGIGSRGIVSVIRWLEIALRDPQIAGVLLRPRGSGIGLAYAQEIRMMVEALREAGKEVVCHLDDASGSEYYACAGATQVLLDPAGGVRLSGIANTVMFFGEFLRNIGVRADFVRIGAFKSAIEQYHNDGQTRAAREQRARMLDQAYRRMTFDLGRDLALDDTQVHALVDDGPFLPEAAREADLIDAFADEYAMGEPLREAFGAAYPRQRERPTQMPERWAPRPRIGVVMIDGSIVDGDQVDIPLLEIHTSGGRTVVQAIDRMASDPLVEAIVVRIDSPGGSVLASDQIYRAIRRARRRKPVIASLGAVAASGGYYVAAAADEIWADPSTLTGSIGVWFGKVDFVPLGEMVGISLDSMQRGAHAGITSLYRPFTPDERLVLAQSVRHWYRNFLRRVARGRGMSVAEVDALARGRLWSGDEARANGLVDHLGGFASALAAARRAAGTRDDAAVIVLPRRPRTLLDYALNALGVAHGQVDPVQASQSADQNAVLGRVLPELQPALQALVTMRHAQSGMPLALMPEVILPE